jgi:hypothetical protein
MTTFSVVDFAKHGIRKSGKFYYKDGKRISTAEVWSLIDTCSSEEAQQDIAETVPTMVANTIEAIDNGTFWQADDKPAPVATPVLAPTGDSWTFDKLNAATQAFFFQLCEQLQEATKDASMITGAKIGKDLPNIGLSNAPRLTNLKKAGVFEHGGKGWLQLTERGRAIFLATI